MNVDAIPAELRNLDRWVVWRWEPDPERPDKPKKPPYCPGAPERHASSTKAETWGTFEQALELVDAGKADGIGFALEPPFVGVDLDGELAKGDRGAIMACLDSYAETSASGTGAHVILRANLNGHGRHPAGIGVFQTDRFFYCTGAHVRGTPTTIEDRHEQLEEVLARFLPANHPFAGTIREPQPVDLDDRDLLDRAMASRDGAEFSALWNGDTGRFDDDHSAADLALCRRLAFWTGRDPARIDRLFRASGLMREKWDRDDYRERTINAAIAGTTDVYRPLSRNVTPTLQPSDPSLLLTREVPTDFPGKSASCGLEGIIGAFGELLVMPDPGAIEIALASIVANYAPGDAVWPLLVGPPGCGKSEIVTAMTGAHAVWSLSSLTPQTLLSGFERKGKAKGPPASMLLQIGPFGILALKDLTTVLTMHREARAQIIGQLREVADGKTEKSFGNGLRVEWEGKLGLLAGVTPVIDDQHAVLSVMGERFMFYRMPEVTRVDVARRSLRRRGHEEELRTRIRGMVAEFLVQFRDVGRLDLPDRFTESLIALADVVTRARSGVARDYQTRDILYLPEPEVPTRLVKQIAQLMAAALAIGVDEGEAWRIAHKVGWDSVPAVRSAVIRLLSRYQSESLTRAELQEKTGLPATTVNRVVEDLVVLGLAAQTKDQSGKWLVAESGLARGYWDSESAA